MMIDQSNFKTPLELWLNLQYRTSRKLIKKTDFGGISKRIQQNKEILSEHNNSIFSIKPRKKNTRTIEIEAERLESECDEDQNYKIVSYNFK